MNLLEEGESLWATVKGKPVRYFAAPTWYLAREAASMRDVHRVEGFSADFFNLREGRELKVKRPDRASTRRGRSAT